MKQINETLKEPEIAYILSEVNKALNYLHGHHRIHRDVKGTNIMLTKSGNVKLIDFGISCEIPDAMAKRHTSVGTPFWMAPEVILCEQQMNSSEYDSRCGNFRICLSLCFCVKSILKNQEVLKLPFLQF